MNDATLQLFRDLADAMHPKAAEAARDWAVCRTTTVGYDVVRYGCTEAEAKRWAGLYRGGYAAPEAVAMPSRRMSA